MTDTYTPPTWKTTDTPAWTTADGYTVTRTDYRYGSYRSQGFTVRNRYGSVVECCDTADQARAEIDADREERKAERPAG